MKNSITYYWIGLMMAFIISFSAAAQRSPSDTKDHGERTIRKEQKRERKRADRTSKLSANAENGLSDKPQYKKRTKVKVKHEKAPSEKRRKKRGRNNSEIRD
ncbi:MAG: hypothetical protein V4677_06210 [Bacteroidota bacterium]